MRVPDCSGHVYAAPLQGSFVHTSSVVLRHSVANEVCPFDESLTPDGEGFDFHLRTTQVSQVGLIDVATVLYRVEAVDQLSEPQQHLRHPATNAVRTVEKAPSPSTDDARRSRRTAQRAEVHTWFGRELLEQGSRSQAPRHLRVAWRQSPNRSRSRDLIESHLPLGFRRQTSEPAPMADSERPA